jgi:Ca2+/H+ antiporter
MDLVFDNPLELVAIASVALAVNAITRDDEATWFEGVLLLGRLRAPRLRILLRDAASPMIE